MIKNLNTNEAIISINVNSVMNRPAAKLSAAMLLANSDSNGRLMAQPHICIPKVMARRYRLDGAIPSGKSKSLSGDYDGNTHCPVTLTSVCKKGASKLQRMLSKHKALLEKTASSRYFRSMVSMESIEAWHRSIPGFKHYPLTDPREGY